MKKYNFDKVDTSNPVDHKEIVEGLMIAISVLSSAISNGSDEKADEILRKFDHALEYNKDNPCSTAIALLAKLSRMSMIGEH